MIALLLLSILPLGIHDALESPLSFNGCVYDEARVLSDDEASAIQNDCRVLNTLGQPTRLFVVTAQNTRGLGDQFALNLFHQWGARPDSVLVMVAPSERKWRIVVGSALRGSISDARATDIGKAFGIPAFRNALWGTGLISIERNLIPLMVPVIVQTVLPPPPMPVTRKTTTTSTTTRVAPVAPVVSVVAQPSHGISGFWILFIVVTIALLIYYIFRTIQERQEAEDKQERKAEEARLRRAATPTQPSKRFGDDEYSPPRTSHRRVSAPAPAVIHQQPIVVPPVVVAAPPIIIRPSYPAAPIVIIDEPYVPPVFVERSRPAPVVVEQTTTTTTVEETGGGGGSFDSPSPGGGGGSFDSSPSDPGGGGGSFDSGPSSDSGGGGGDSGGGGGDF